jgi:hypothetical protein
LLPNPPMLRTKIHEQLALPPDASGSRKKRESLRSDLNMSGQGSWLESKVVKRALLHDYPERSIWCCQYRVSFNTDIKSILKTDLKWLEGLILNGTCFSTKRVYSARLFLGAREHLVSWMYHGACCDQAFASWGVSIGLGIWQQPTRMSWCEEEEFHRAPTKWIAN